MINMDYSIQHHNSLQNAHRGVDDMIHSGNELSKKKLKKKSIDSVEAKGGWPPKAELTTLEKTALYF